jgi:tRNA (guanine37-N1)-methyltransferase
MRINVITLFPEMFSGVFNESMVSRAMAKDIISIRFVPLRDFGLGAHRVVDDTPYGGGGGMILKPEPIAAAIESLEDKGRVILTTPRGRLFSQDDALRLSVLETLTIICGIMKG